MPSQDKLSQIAIAISPSSESDYQIRGHALLHRLELTARQIADGGIVFGANLSSG
jgi:hypothetical protein